MYIFIERENQRETERQRDRERDRHTDGDRERQRLKVECRIAGSNGHLKQVRIMAKLGNVL